MKAWEICERYKYQQNPTIQVSITYEAKITKCFTVPKGMSHDEIIEELKGGYAHDESDIEDYDAPRFEYNGIIECIVDGDVIKLKK